MNRHTGFAFVLAAAVFAAGCDVNVDQDTDPAVQPGLEQQDPNQTGTQPMPPPDPAGEMRIEVNLQARELYVYRNNQRTATHSVAVGSSEWPTRTGEWTIDEVVLNPRWVPPEEEWAEDEEPAEPGDDDNPLGAAQLIYDAPRSIHGTNEPGSIGQAVSHGSIRVTNEVALELAREAMRAGGADRGEDAIREAEQNPDRSVNVRLPRGIPIRVTNSGS